MCDYIVSLFRTYTTPFKQLDILSFKKLVVQRISLLMFKYYIAITNIQINNIFIVNTTHHAY